MNKTIEQLCGDPLFQLNLAIWLAQSKPKDFSVRPIFYENGFRIYSIGPLLPLPLAIRLTTKESTLDCQDGARPDLVLEANNRTKFCMLECKRNSFGKESTTSSQARTLMIMSGPIISEVLAIGGRGLARGILCYFTKSDQTHALESTLGDLTYEIEKINLKPGTYGCLGIIAKGSAIYLEYSDELKTNLNIQNNPPVSILTIEEDTDPRPMYIIPYEPSVFNEQSEDEEKLCRRILFERFLSHILSKIGSGMIPSQVVFTKDAILNAATFGLYKLWDDNDAKKHLRRLILEFMHSLVNALEEDFKGLIAYEVGRGLVVKLEDKKTHEEIITQISRFKPESMDLRKKIQPELFDE